MAWPKKYFQQQAEVVLNNFDLTPEEVNAVVKEWNEEINDIPDAWYTNADPGHEENHALASLQRIALRMLRTRATQN